MAGKLASCPGLEDGAKIGGLKNEGMSTEVFENKDGKTPNKGWLQKLMKASGMNVFSA